MNKLFKKVGKILLILLAIIGLYLLAVWILPNFSVNSKNDSPQEVAIYILSNGVHTDIVCPIKNDQINWNQWVSVDDTQGKNHQMQYASFGWGDKGFYLDTPTWAELKFSTAFKAAFWLGDAAMHLTFYPSMIESESCKKIMISKAEYELLINYIKNSFDVVNQKVIPIKTDMVYGKDDAFYEAKGTYNIFFTCNTWANDALKAAKQKAALWSATDTGIFKQYQ